MAGSISNRTVFRQRRRRGSAVLSTRSSRIYWPVSGRSLDGGFAAITAGVGSVRLGGQLPVQRDRSRCWSFQVYPIVCAA